MALSNKAGRAIAEAFDCLRACEQMMKRNSDNPKEYTHWKQEYNEHIYTLRAYNIPMRKWGEVEYTC